MPTAARVQANTLRQVNQRFVDYMTACMLEGGPTVRLGALHSDAYAALDESFLRVDAVCFDTAPAAAVASASSALQAAARGTAATSGGAKVPAFLGEFPLDRVLDVARLAYLVYTLPDAAPSVAYAAHEEVAPLVPAGGGGRGTGAPRPGGRSGHPSPYVVLEGHEPSDGYGLRLHPVVAVNASKCLSASLLFLRAEGLWKALHLEDADDTDAVSRPAALAAGRAATSAFAKRVGKRYAGDEDAEDDGDAGDGDDDAGGGDTRRAHPETPRRGSVGAASVNGKAGAGSLSVELNVIKLAAARWTVYPPAIAISTAITRGAGEVHAAAHPRSAAAAAPTELPPLLQLHLRPGKKRAYHVGADGSPVTVEQFALQTLTSRHDVDAIQMLQGGDPSWCPFRAERLAVTCSHDRPAKERVVDYRPDDDDSGDVATRAGGVQTVVPLPRGCAGESPEECAERASGHLNGAPHLITRLLHGWTHMSSELEVLLRGAARMSTVGVPVGLLEEAGVFVPTLRNEGKGISSVVDPWSAFVVDHPTNFSSRVAGADRMPWDQVVDAGGADGTGGGAVSPRGGAYCNGWRGVHGENIIWRTMFEVICWDVVYLTPVHADAMLARALAKEHATAPSSSSSSSPAAVAAGATAADGVDPLPALSVVRAADALPLSTVRSLVALARGSWRYPWQHKPLGSVVTNDVSERRQLLNAWLDLIETADRCALAAMVSATYRDHFGECCRDVRWEAVPEADMVEMVHAAGGKALKAILTGVLRYETGKRNERACGLPDLVLWRPLPCPGCELSCSRPTGGDVEVHMMKGDSQPRYVKLLETTTAAAAGAASRAAGTSSSGSGRFVFTRSATAALQHRQRARLPLGADIATPDFVLLEVKSKNDRIQKHQLEWLGLLKPDVTVALVRIVDKPASPSAAASAASGGTAAAIRAGAGGDGGGRAQGTGGAGAAAAAAAAAAPTAGARSSAAPAAKRRKVA